MCFGFKVRVSIIQPFSAEPKNITIQVWVSWLQSWSTLIQFEKLTGNFKSFDFASIVSNRILSVLVSSSFYSFFSAPLGSTNYLQKLFLVTQYSLSSFLNFLYSSWPSFLSASDKKQKTNDTTLNKHPRVFSWSDKGDFENYFSINWNNNEISSTTLIKKPIFFLLFIPKLINHVWSGRKDAFFSSTIDYGFYPIKVENMLNLSSFISVRFCAFLAMLDNFQFA